MENFRFDWFLTVPGMLITGGVVLLFIALIIFIVTSRKSKKVHNPLEQAPVANTVAATPNPVEVNPNLNGGIQPAVPVENPSVVVPNSAISDLTSPAPTGPQVVDPATVMAATASTDVSPAIPVIPAPTSSSSSNSTVSQPAVIDSSVVSNTVSNGGHQASNAPIYQTVPANNSAPVDAIVNPVIPATPVVPNNNVYGGMSSTPSNVGFNQAMNSHQINGGNMPMGNPTISNNIRQEMPVSSQNVSVSSPMFSQAPSMSSPAVPPIAPTVHSTSQPPTTPILQPTSTPTPSVQSLGPNVIPTVTPSVGSQPIPVAPGVNPSMQSTPVSQQMQNQ